MEVQQKGWMLELEGIGDEHRGQTSLGRPAIGRPRRKQQVKEKFRSEKEVKGLDGKVVRKRDMSGP